LTTTVRNFKSSPFGPPGSRSSVFDRSVRANVLDSFFPKWSLIAPEVLATLFVCILEAMSCCSYWILCTSCLTCWLIKLADRVLCYVCTFRPANVKYSVVCLPERCLYCYNCTVFLFICTLFPQWQTDVESMIYVRLYLLRALRSAQQEVHVWFRCYYPLYYFVNCFLLILFSVKLIILLLFLVYFALYILIIYHKAPTNQDSITQRTEGEISASPRIDTQSTLSVGGGNRGLNTHTHAPTRACVCVLSLSQNRGKDKQNITTKLYI